jgi:NOL1/NOP2/fmu family ribosome biogenesis protein
LLKFQKLPNREHLEFYIKEFFGIPLELFKEHEFYASTRDVWMMPKNLFEVSQDFDLEHAGLRIFSSPKPPFKPTHYFATLYGKHAQKNCMELNCEQAKVYFDGGDISMPNPNPEQRKGYVLVIYQNDCIGVAMWAGENLRSQFPKKFNSYIKKDLL